jgi:hypothetical protein
VVAVTARVVVNGRTWFTNQPPQPKASRALPRDRLGDPVDCAQAIPPTSAQSPFVAGVTLVDKEEGLSYRCVTRLDYLDGWGVTAFWQKRWDVDHKAIVAFASAGLLDAAVEAQSQVRRYRCRDEAALKASEVFRRQRKRVVTVRSNQRALEKMRRS